MIAKQEGHKVMHNKKMTKHPHKQFEKQLINNNGITTLEGTPQGVLNIFSGTKFSPKILLTQNLFSSHEGFLTITMYERIITDKLL